MTTADPPTTYIYHATTNAEPAKTYIDRTLLTEWARAGRHAPDLDAPLLDASVRATTLTALDALEAATRAYAAASAALADALAADADARLNLAYLEDDFRARAHTQGVPGANQAARDAILATSLADDPTVDEARQARDAAHRARLREEHGFRVADQCQKSLRARLEALSGLVRGGEA